MLPHLSPSTRGDGPCGGTERSGAPSRHRSPQCECCNAWRASDRVSDRVVSVGGVVGSPILAHAPQEALCGCTGCESDRLSQSARKVHLPGRFGLSFFARLWRINSLCVVLFFYTDKGTTLKTKIQGSLGCLLHVGRHDVCHNSVI